LADHLGDPENFVGSGGRMVATNCVEDGYIFVGLLPKRYGQAANGHVSS